MIVDLLTTKVKNKSEKSKKKTTDLGTNEWNNQHCNTLPTDATLTLKLQATISNIPQSLKVFA